VEHIAIDLGGRESQICVRTSDGAIVEEKRWPTSGLERYLKARPPGRVILETSAEAFAVADLAKRLGHEVRVIPSVLVKTLGVGARGIKNDRNDAQATSKASCQVELPSVHIPSVAARELKAITASREALVETRTKLVNATRSWMRTQLVAPLKRGSPETLPTRMREKLLGTECGIPNHLERILVSVEALNEQVAKADEEVARLANENEVCRRLMTVPGVGPVTSARYVAAIDDVKRFEEAHDVESYLGLTPGEHVTGFKGNRTHLTKAGQSKVRWALVQAAWTAIRTRRGDPMVRWALEVARRRGRRIAAVALARKLAGILYALWRDGATYDPRRGASKSEEEPMT